MVSLETVDFYLTDKEREFIVMLRSKDEQQILNLCKKWGIPFNANDLPATVQALGYYAEKKD